MRHLFRADIRREFTPWPTRMKLSQRSQRPVFPNWKSIDIGKLLSSIRSNRCSTQFESWGPPTQRHPAHSRCLAPNIWLSEVTSNSDWSRTVSCCWTSNGFKSKHKKSSAVQH